MICVKMARLTQWILMIAVGIASSPAHSEPAPLSFTYKKARIKTLDLRGLNALVTQENISIFEPHELTTKNLIAFDFKRVLEKIYGKKLNQAKRIVFTCLDGYQPSIE